jgi:Ca2+-binding EF-hand superfamily protein
MPAKAGIQVEWRGKAWIPAFAGMTREQNLRGADRPSAIVVQHERRLLAGPAVVIGGGFRGRPVRATMYHMITVLVLLFTLLMPGAATAEPTPETAGRDELERRFRLADRDGDGVLSAAEARQGGWFVDRMEDFERIDRDRSGTITLFEIVGALSEKVQDWLGADADQDGRVSEAEAKRRPGIFGQVFRDADRDGDGYVTREEIELLSQRSYYRDAELPSVAPNIIEKRF